MRKANGRETSNPSGKRHLNRSRNTFWALLLLDVLIGLEILRRFQAGGAAGEILGTPITVVLIWALAVSAYAYCAWRRPVKDEAPTGGATTDSRTGLFTMDYVKTCMEHERRRSEESGVSAAIVYLDLVNLDRVNHAFGFTVGDIVLKALAAVMADQIRPGDILACVGGDEFMIVMPETCTSEAVPVAEAIRKAVAGYRLDLGKKGVIDFMECRYGLASFPADGRSAEEVAATARANLQVPQPV